jgi:predicted transcriptional regulator
MLDSEKNARMTWELLEQAGISESLVSTAKVALQQLVADGLVQRIDKGIKGDPYLYFKAGK